MSSRTANRGWALALLALVPLGALAQGGPQCKLEAKVTPVNQVVTEGGDVTLNGEPSQPGDAIFVWTQRSGPTITLNLSRPSKPTFIAPQVDSDQQAVFRLTVFGCGSSDFVDTRIDIQDKKPPANTVPTAAASASPELADEGAIVTLSSTGTTDTETPQSLAYQWTQVANGAPTVILSGANSPTATFTAPQVTGAGVTLEFNLRVTDLGGLFDDDDALVNVQFSNDSPFASLYCPMHAGEGAMVTLDGSASSDYEDDALGKSLQYQWRQMLGPPYVDVSEKTTASITFPAPALGYGETGRIEFELKVTDSAGVFSTTTCGLIVDDVTRPVFAGGGDRIVEATSPDGATVNYGLTATDNVDGDLTAFIKCTPASGSAFDLNEPTQVNCSVKDSAGNEAKTSFQVVVGDRTRPVIAAHNDVAVEATGPSGATVNYELPLVTDVVDVDLAATCTPPPGVFAVGSHTVTCNAVDFSQNAAATTTFKVTVHDETPPVVTVPGSITREATSSAGAAVEFDVSAFDIVDEDITATCKLGNTEVNSGDTFPLGSNTVDCEATDTAGNTGNASFTITVEDTTEPTLTLPADITEEAKGAGGNIVTFTATADDIVDGAAPVTCYPPSGSVFEITTTTVACSAKDAAGNTAQGMFSVTVQDTTDPTLTLPANIVAEATSGAGAAVPFSVTASDIVDANVAIVCAPPSGSTFAITTTTVNCTATDDYGNEASGDFTVKVQDTTAPTLNLPTNIVAEATSAAGAAVSFSVTADDVVDANVAIVCAPPSGSTFAIATTTVNCTATDDYGNAASGGFTVKVQDTTAPVFNPYSDVTAIATANSEAVVNFALPTATDLVDSEVEISCTHASGTFPAGTTTVKCTAKDDSGNVATMSFNVIVTYAFSGFFSPVDNLPIVNTVQAGQSIPVKFSLGGYQGMGIFATGYPRSTVMTCSGALQDSVEETSSAGSSTLTFDPTTGRYHYVWKTEKAWAGTCRQLQIKFIDGKVQVANFYFKK